MKTGIYKIQNLINNKIYIGQSKNINQRFKRHLKTAEDINDHSYNNPLYQAIRKYGKENFSFSIIQECSIEELNERQKYWISYYNSFFEGYNLTFGGDGAGNKLNKEKIINIISDLENTSLTQKEIANNRDISEQMVQGINTGRYWKHDRQYPIRKPKIKKKNYCIDCGEIITSKAIRCEKCYRITTRKSERPLREELKFLIRTKSFKEIGRIYSVSDNAIRKWCISMDLPSKKTEIKKYSNEEWEKI